MIDLSNAVVFDCETFPNVFTLNAQSLNDDASATWEISEFRDDRVSLMHWFEYLRNAQIPMIGFNSLHFDYPVIHHLYNRPQISVDEIYSKAMQIIGSNDAFAHTIWPRDRFAPQIDLFKINHFDNRAKTTSLKALQINMRAPSVVDMPVEIGTRLSHEQTQQLLIPYNVHDTAETKRFAWFCMDAIKFRIGLMDQSSSLAVEGDVMNFNDTKIGEQLLIQRIGKDVCFSGGYRDENDTYIRKSPRQTHRNRIALRDVIFPYIRFDNPEFARVLDWMKSQVLAPEDLTDEDAPAQTKGVFKNIKANVGGIDFYFGTGGIHASVTPQRILSDHEWAIDDVDVRGFYPKAAIVNNLAPAHLGEAYTREYKRLPEERQIWIDQKGKKCVEANALKLSGNGVYGKSNSPFSCFYDPQYTMSVTINCQLLLCMLAEWLLTVPTLQIIQANTDGITYRIHRSYRAQAEQVWKAWERFTCLELESVEYKRMFIRDVNNYIAEDMKGNLKQKGAYWHPDPHNYAKSISESQPPAWHKDLGNVISIRAAVIAMVHGVDPAVTIPLHRDPYDFMLRAKVGKESKLMLGECEIQRTSRYYVVRDGYPLNKVLPPAGPRGAFKRGTGVSEATYMTVMAANNWQWDATVCTKNKSKYEDRVTAFEAGWKVAECNNVDSFEWDNVNFQYYIDEARKLII